MRSATYANAAATLAVLLAGAALAVALTGDDEAAGPAATTGAATVAFAAGAERAEQAERAKTAERADTAERAESAVFARRARVADRLVARLDRQLRAAVRGARGVRPAISVTAAPGQTKPLLRSPPFRFRLVCSQAPREQTRLVLTARSDEGDALFSLGGRAGQSVPEGQDKPVIELISARPLWSGGSAFSLQTAEGDAVHGVVSFGLDRLGGACAASMNGVAG